MKRAIFVVQALALLSACRSDSTVTGPEVTHSSGEEQPIVASDGATDADVDAAALEQSDTEGASSDASATSAASDAEPPIDARRGTDARRGLARTIVSANRCSDRNPEGMGCQTLGASCSGGVSHCASGPPNTFRPCSGELWECRCDESENGPAWGCRVQMHAAGPMPPPELA